MGAGSNEGDAGAGAGAGERGVLREKSVPWVDRVDLFFRGERDDALEIEVGFDRPFAFADKIRFVGLESMQREAIFLRINGYRAQPEFIGRAQDADSDFAAIQSKEFFH